MSSSPTPPQAALTLLQRKKLRSHSVITQSEPEHTDHTKHRSSTDDIDTTTAPSLPLSIDTVNLTHSPSATQSSSQTHTGSYASGSPKFTQRRSSLSGSHIPVSSRSSARDSIKQPRSAKYTSLLHNASLAYVNDFHGGAVDNTLTTISSNDTQSNADTDISAAIFDENSHLPPSQSNDSIASLNVLTQRVLAEVNDDGATVRPMVVDEVDVDVTRRTALSQRRQSNSHMQISEANSGNTSPAHHTVTDDSKRPLFVATVVDSMVNEHDITDATIDVAAPAQQYSTPHHSPKHNHQTVATPTTATGGVTRTVGSARKTLTNDINALLNNMSHGISHEYSKRLQSPGHSRRGTMTKPAMSSPFLSRTGSRLTSPLHGRSPAASRPQSPVRHAAIQPRDSSMTSPTSSARRLFDSQALVKQSPKRMLFNDDGKSSTSTLDSMLNNTATVDTATASAPNHLRSPSRAAHDTVFTQPMRSLNYTATHTPHHQHVQSDRFIPSRTASHLESARAESPPKQLNNNTDGTQTAESKDIHFMTTYSTLLKNELLGGDVTAAPSLSRRTSLNHTGTRSTTPHHAATEPSNVGTPQSHRRPTQAVTPTSGGLSNKVRTFSFRSPTKSLSSSSLHDAFNQSLVSKQSERLLQQRTTPPRKIQRAAYRVLDAPQLKDDYYLNLVDWSDQNCIGVALGSSVYIWNANTSRVTKLLQLNENNHVCSLQWSRTGNHIAVGTKHGSVHLWDVTTQQLVRAYDGHTLRVSALAFNYNLLASGSRDRNIVLRDARVPDTERSVSVLRGHKQEVCGLKWSPDDQQLASGGNDNRLYIWSAKQTSQPQLKFCDHRGAVKAIAWSPHQTGLLCSGGGTADKHIRFWNTLTSPHDMHSNNPLSPLSPSTPDLYNRNLSDVNERSAGRALHAVDTGSQVCQLAWSSTCNEIVSTHGYSLNQIIVWKYNHNGVGEQILQPISTLTGHNMRVLYLAMSPDGQSVVTGAGDETLRFWNIFPPKNQDDSKLGSPLKLPNLHSIR